MSKLPVAKRLSDAEYQMLLAIYSKHNSSMGLSERKKYTLSDIVKVKRNKAKGCLEVHYSNGDWWHYSANGSWY